MITSGVGGVFQICVIGHNDGQVYYYSYLSPLYPVLELYELINYLKKHKFIRIVSQRGFNRYSYTCIIVTFLIMICYKLNTPILQ